MLMVPRQVLSTSSDDAMSHQKKAGPKAAVYNYGVQNAPAKQDPPKEEDKEYESLEEALLGE